MGQRGHAHAERQGEADLNSVTPLTSTSSIRKTIGYLVGGSRSGQKGCRCHRHHAAALTPSTCGAVCCYHGVMAKNLTVRLDDELAADAEALARAEGQSLNETVKVALREAVERRRKDPKFTARVRRIIDEDRELLERLAK